MAAVYKKQWVIEHGDGATTILQDDATKAIHSYTKRGTYTVITTLVVFAIGTTVTNTNDQN